MPRVAAEISVSLDGFIEGPKDQIIESLDILHDWVIRTASWRAAHGMEGGETGQDSDVMEESWRNLGAVVMGRNMFDIGKEPWGEEPPFRVPVFVLTHRGGDPIEMKGGTTFHFVTEGVEAALERAHEAAGDKDVSVAGGAQAIQQVLDAGLLDELQMHVVPVLLGQGTRLFDNAARRELKLTRVIDSPGVTHMRYAVGR